MARLSFTTMGTPEMTGVEAIEAARKYGYQGVDLRVSENKGELTVDATNEEIAALRRAFDGEGIAPAGLLCYNDRPSKDPGSWKLMEDSLLRHLEIGAMLGSPTIRMFGGAIHEYDSPEDFITRSADVLASVFERDASDVKIVLQNHGGSYTFLQGVALAKQLAHPRFGMVFSPDHCVMMGEDMDAVCAVAKTFSLQLYVSDVAPSDDPESKRAFHGILPGGGVVPLRRAYHAIGGDAFDGWISFKWEKIWQNHLEEPEIALPHFMKYFKSHLP